MKGDVSEKSKEWGCYVVVYQFVCGEYNSRVVDQINYQYLSFRIRQDQLLDPKLVHIKRNGLICANIVIPGPRNYRKMLRHKPVQPQHDAANNSNNSNHADNDNTLQQDTALQQEHQQDNPQKLKLLENQTIIGHQIEGQDLFLKLKYFDQEVLYNFDQLAENDENRLIDQLIDYITINKI